MGKLLHFDQARLIKKRLDKTFDNIGKAAENVRPAITYKKWMSGETHFSDALAYMTGALRSEKNQSVYK